MPSTEQATLSLHDLASLIERYLGQPTPGTQMPAPDFTVRSAARLGDCEHRVLRYHVEDGEPVEAHLLLPPAARRRGGAAVLCLHGTSVEAKDTQIGLGSKPGRDFGRQLADRGFITLSPDHACSGIRQRAGDKPYDSASFYERHPEWSMVGKAIWDGRQAVNVLTQIEGVDASRIGVVGHSLGGHGSLFLTAMEPRIRAAACSCGLGTWRPGNPSRFKWAREEWYRYLPALREHFDRDEPTPFDLLDFVRLIAPRPVLNLSGLGDEMYGMPYAIAEIGLELHRHYQQLGEPDRFANYLFGGGHDVPPDCRALIAGWFERWLA